MFRSVVVFLLSTLFLIGIGGFERAHAQTDSRLYDIGTPTLIDLWIDPVNGSDDNSGTSADTALRTVDAAWNRIPMGIELVETGYHLWLLPGDYSADNLPGYWESRYGTFEHPIVIESAEGAASVNLAGVNLFDSRYVYFVNLTLDTGTDVFHCERCDHLLLRGNTLIGADPETYNTQETVKINQSQNIYLENNDISGAWNNGVDFVAVQYGHIVGNRIHNAGDWCMYLKGGSAYFRVEANTLYDCDTGGFSAGQGTGFQFMIPPWIQYEAYFIEFVNNVVHDTVGAGVGVQGGYNILIAYNTFYRVGKRSHLLEVVFGSRSCDGQPGDEGRERCDEYRQLGGWGNSIVADGENYVRIPNRHVYIFNNLFYNPPDDRSEDQQFTIFAPYSADTQADSGVPVPTLTDDDLHIVGNLIWNGGAGLWLGVEWDAGCTADNLTCNEAQLRRDNLIDTLEPQLAAPDDGDFHLLSADFGGLVRDLPQFVTLDLPAGVESWEGDSDVTVDFDGTPRTGRVPGAFELGA